MKTATIEAIKKEYQGLKIDGEWYSAKFGEPKEVFDNLEKGDTVEFEAGAGKSGKGIKTLRKVSEKPQEAPQEPNETQAATDPHEVMKECVQAVDAMMDELRCPTTQQAIQPSSIINTLFMERMRRGK